MVIKNKKRLSICISVLIIFLCNFTGCSSDKERDAWVAQKMANVPEVQANLDDIAQVTSEREEYSRAGTHYVREASVMLKFKMDDKTTIDRNFKPNEIEIKKDLNPDDKSYVVFKFVDIDITSEIEYRYRIERGIYNIVVHLPSNYFVREIDNRKNKDK